MEENWLCQYDKAMNISNLKTITFSELEPDTKRRTTAEVSQYLKNFEECLENYNKDFPFSLLHYAFIFRRFDAVNMIRDALSYDEWIKVLNYPGPEGYEKITPLVCAKWNLFYLYGYDSKNDTDLASELEGMMDELDHIDEVVEYTDIVDEEKQESVFDIFWWPQQPILDVIYYSKQELASKQVKNNCVSLVMDEVGTGKTVSAIYAIRNIIENCNAESKQAHILIICPHNKREDWQNDIRRQLGHYAHIVEQGDNGDMYRNELKKAFFKGFEEVIMISGQKGGGDGKGSHTELKNSLNSYSDKEKWDLVIIDEGHISFQNYVALSSEKAMILSATPIVVNATGRRSFEDYKVLLRRITGKSVMHFDIKPIDKSVPDENDIYVNWFKEDMGKKSAERNIQFVSCERAEERNELFYDIYNEKGALTALQYDQDDEYLFSKYNEIFSDSKSVVQNHKLDKLIEILKENDKSYIIFCEHEFVVHLIYERLKEEFSDIVIAEKNGKNENHCGLGNVQDGQLINTLVQVLRNGERALFVTTGKTGGTGLNLGEFDGVIHYELPFTSIELEQRFGRVDRIDTRQDLKKRDMIFMLNECGEDDNDNEINRMLYYCVNKIDITCKYMPVRNTVLYYPEFIRRNRDALKHSLKTKLMNTILSEQNETDIKKYISERRSYENKIKANFDLNKILREGKSIYKCAEEALHSEKDSSISADSYVLLAEYTENWNEHKVEINRYNRAYREFCKLRKQVKNWLAIIGLLEVENENEIFTGFEETDNFEEQKIENLEEQAESDEDAEGKNSVQKQIKDLIKIIDESDFDNLELKGFSSDGVFCLIDEYICRSDVQSYRNGDRWK
ncbi:MAG: DEAD/DEAH box helicase family protein [Oscillospiraceae bacterium]|nr:DEAD/DEAH box helicase family protein [Oscillospiraceae bacterium]